MTYDSTVRSNESKINCKETDLAYIAGFIDGEGSIMIRQNRANSRSGEITNGFALNLVISQKSRVPLDFITRRLGGHAVFIDRKYRSAKAGTDSWQLRYVAVTAQRILRAVLPYLVFKRNIAWLAICFQEHVLRWKHKFNPKDGLPTHVWEARAAACEIVKKVNHFQKTPVNARPHIMPRLPSL